MSGLLACKYAVSVGLRPMVFEAQQRVGGLWNETMESTRLQIDKAHYQFSDFPWPSSVEGDFPKNTQVSEYAESYAHHFQLLDYVKFDSRVISIDYVGESHDEMESWELWGGSGKAFASKGNWILKVEQPASVQEYEVEFVVLCTGRFSGLPDIPEFPPGHGPDVFTGEVLHSMDYSAMDNARAAELIKGKRIAVIGSGKSAIDLAFECACANGRDQPCIMIQRTSHWMFPSTRLWLFIYGFLFFIRFSELMVHKPGEGLFFSILATVLSPLRWVLSNCIESGLRWVLPLKKFGMIPNESFVQEASSCQPLFLPENFFRKVEDGSIVVKKLQHFSFCKEGLIIDGIKQPIEADIVIFATGYKGDEKLKNIFASPTFQSYIFGSPNSIIPLYRQMVHPRIPQLAVLGYSESLSNLYTFEIRSKWLAFFLDQAFHLPSIQQMEEEIKMWDRYMKKYAGNSKFRRNCIGGIHIWYNDQLCRDMGFNPRRKNGVLSELFETYGPEDYSEINPAQQIL